MIKTAKTNFNKKKLQKGANVERTKMWRWKRKSVPTVQLCWQCVKNNSQKNKTKQQKTTAKMILKSFYSNNRILLNSQTIVILNHTHVRPWTGKLDSTQLQHYRIQHQSFFNIRFHPTKQNINCLYFYSVECYENNLLQHNENLKFEG